MSAYRWGHYHHHAHLGTEKDIELWPYVDPAAPRGGDSCWPPRSCWAGSSTTPLVYSAELQAPAEANVFPSYLSALSAMLRTLSNPRVGAQWRDRSRAPETMVPSSNTSLSVAGEVRNKEGFKRAESGRKRAEVHRH